jgi:lipoprotein-releasing system permease protein
MNSNLMPFELIAAVRFLREGIVQSLLIIVGVSVGVSVIVFLSALLFGLQNNLVDRVLSAQAQINILPPKETATHSFMPDDAKVIRVIEARTQRRTTIDQWRKVLRTLRNMPGINVASPTASGPVFIYQGSAVRNITLKGIEPNQYFSYIAIPQNIVSGNARISGQDVLIGKDLAEDLGIKINSKILLRTSNGGSLTLNVRGIYDLGNKAFNARSIFTTLNTAQGLLGIVGEVTGVDVVLDDPYAANSVADLSKRLFSVEADSWIRTNAQFFTAIRSQNISSGVIRAAVALSVALGIASVLAVSVTQRSREIGILRAMGASRGQVMRVFLLQGGIFALIGSIIGSVLARGILEIWMTYARNPDGTAFFTIGIEPWLYVVATILATVCGVLAAVIPAFRASRLDPVVAIRG